MILFFDTETTGLVNFKEEPTAPGQPRLVQLALLCCDHKGNEIEEYITLVKPDNYIIPPNMIHGITHEVADRDGIDGHIVAAKFSDLLHKSELLVAHNIHFDWSVMLNHLFHTGFEIADGVYYNTFCTMEAMTPICKLPSKVKTKWKWPRLAEAYKFLFGVELEGAHDALNDVRATKKIYFEFKRRYVTNEWNLNPA